MTHARRNHSKNEGLGALYGVTIVSYNDRLGPLLERQRELAAAKNFWQARWDALDRKLDSVPESNEERIERLKLHKQTIGGHLRTLKDETSSVRAELTHVRQRIKEAGS